MCLTETKKSARRTKENDNEHARRDRDPDPQGDWEHSYVHYDLGPRTMLAALAAHDPQAILAAREIRAITPKGIQAFVAPRAPERRPAPTKGIWAKHLYTLKASGWRHA